jgi:hypothetical protein
MSNGEEGGKAATKRDLAEQIESLNEKVAGLEAALKRSIASGGGIGTAMAPAAMGRTAGLETSFLARAPLTAASQLAVGLPLLRFFQMAPGELEELIQRLQDYLRDPKQLVTGRNSSGDRTDFERRWRQSCRRTLDEQPPAVKTAKRDWYIWDHTLDGEITTHVALTWSYDLCHIYNADLALTVQRNDEPNDYGVVMVETYEEPPRAIDEQYLCHPMPPRCLRAQATLIFYSISTTTGLPQGVSHQIRIDVMLCPGDAENFTDNTDYPQSQGDGNGPKSPQKPPVAPNPTDPGTWGVSRIDRQPDGSWNPHP